MTTSYEISPVGYVESNITDRASAPKQGFEPAPEAWLVFDATVAKATRDLVPGSEVIVLTWLDRAERDVRAVTRGTPGRPGGRRVQHLVEHPPPPGRHLFTTLIARPVHDALHWLRWSQWRRRHQARTRNCHYRRQAAAQR